MRIECTVYPRPWSLSLFVSELALRSARAYYVAKVDGVVVGYAGLMLTGDEAHVTNIAVAPDWQRHRIATRLLLTLARTALERDATGLTLEVRAGNLGAQALYRQFGMSPVGIRRNYYAETNEDAILMTVSSIEMPSYARRLADIEAALPGSTIVEPLARW
jgi:ribosomal-protein-alanine N-acetyltransferase